MINIIEKHKCNGCHSCAQVCPKGAICMDKDNEGFLYPNVDADKCIDCGLCDKVCPEIELYPVSQNTKVLAAYRNDTLRRMKSASGGVFALIAEYILSINGIVFGAKFDDKWELQHTHVESIENLESLLGSKYVQSEIGNSFIEAETFLKEGRIVLFCGTPCQIQGLLKYLRKDYSNLYTIDLVCHGVPSPNVWLNFIDFVQKEKKLTYFRQRDKSKGIKNAPLVFEFNDGSVKKEKYNKNLYMRGFIKNLYLRPSCYKCSFKGVERCSDITLGDFWGLEKIHPEFGDVYGISAFLIHTKKGSDLLECIEKDITCIDSDSAEVCAENISMVESSPINKDRDTFFSLYKNTEINKLIKKLTKIKLSYRIKKSFFELYHKFRHILWIMKNTIIKNK